MGLWYLKMSNWPQDPAGTYFAIALNEAGRYFTFNFLWTTRFKFVYLQLFGKRWSKTWLT